MATPRRRGARHADGRADEKEIDSVRPASLLFVSLSALALVQCAAAVDTVQRPDVAPTDVAEFGIAQLRLAAGEGDARAQVELGARYENGRGVEQDYRAAVAWFRRAAEQGHAPGQA
ncbi:MAG: SEL1-like repeat protein, partial [Acidobacteria bacterium]|nr:SEL1-like repeat protein [Acidobacteriota bacterium]